MCKILAIILTSIVIVSAAIFTMVTLSEGETYLQKRDALLSQEEEAFFGHNVTLTTHEIKVDKLLLEEKFEELASGYKNSSNFLPSLHFFHAKDRIDKSRVFDFIKKIPKGASLHTHLLSAVSADFFIKNVTYRDKLYGGYINDVFKLKFLADPGQDVRCNWTSIKEMRNNQSAAVFDNWLRGQLILNVENPRGSYPDVESVWRKFKKTFTTIYDSVSYKPVFQDYVYQLLQELYDDNVMYAELKGNIMPIYDLEGGIYPKQHFFETFKKAVDLFKKDHPKFIGVRYIYSVYRGVDQYILKESLDEIIEMKRLFPDLIAGFDLVGYEEEGKTLLDYYSELLDVQKDLKFYFHAGETNWFGHTDLNLADAILLNSQRIGHGFALIKHPQLLQLGKKRNIPLEISPISNQVLMLNDDPRNHPAAALMAVDYPLVICNDDPSVWNATGLSYDWYVVFMAMTPRTSGLEVLKQFAINSIVYSSMEEELKKNAMEMWARDWEEFLNDVLEMKSAKENMHGQVDSVYQ